MTSFELLLVYILLTIAGSLALLLIIAGIHKFCTDEDFRAGTLVIGMVIAWIGGIGTFLWWMHPLTLAKVSYVFATYWPHMWLGFATIYLTGAFLCCDTARRFAYNMMCHLVPILISIAFAGLTYLSLYKLGVIYGVK